MLNKVNAILTILNKIYKQCSEDFHEYYINEFKLNIVSLNIHNSNILKFDEQRFCDFIDNCMLYRLGIRIKKPVLSDIVYDLSLNVNPEVYSVPLDIIMEKLLYSSVPSHIVSRINSLIESYDLDTDVINLIMSKLE